VHSRTGLEGEAVGGGGRGICTMKKYDPCCVFECDIVCVLCEHVLGLMFQHRVSWDGVPALFRLPSEF
jgi:hypothetical protein